MLAKLFTGAPVSAAVLVGSLLVLATSSTVPLAADEPKKPAGNSAGFQTRVESLSNALDERAARARATASDLMRHYVEIPNTAASVKKLEDVVARAKVELAKASDALIKADASTKNLRARFDDAKLAELEGELAFVSADLKRAVDRFEWSTRMVTKGYVSPIQNSSDRAGVTKAAANVSQAAVKWQSALGPVSPAEVKSQLGDHMKARSVVESLKRTLAESEKQLASLRSNQGTRGLNDDERRGLKRLAEAERSRREATAILAELSSVKDSTNESDRRKLKTAEELVLKISAELDRASLFSELGRNARQVVNTAEILRAAERAAAEVGLD